MRLLKTTVEFLWWVVGSGGGVCTVIFMSNPTTVLGYVVLCCHWGCDNYLGLPDLVWEIYRAIKKKARILLPNKMAIPPSIS